MKKFGIIIAALLLAAAVLLSGCGKADSFKSGTWASDSGFNYVFNTDGKSGFVANPVDDSDVQFTYESTKDGVVFNMDGIDNAATVKFDEGTATITWSDGSTEILMFVNDSTDEEFAFAYNANGLAADNVED